MTRVHLSLAAATIVVAAGGIGCRGGESGGAGGVHTGVAWLDDHHDAVNLHLTLDTANQRAKWIDSAGGRITANGDDGSFFTLDVPAKALHRREWLTMIPVKSVTGLPLEQGHAMAMVQLEPEGLQFDRPVTLTLESEKPVAPTEHVAFAWIADGRDAHLYPSHVDSLETQMQLLHFSGYGFGVAPQSDPGRIHLEQAAAQEARLEARLSAVERSERRAQLGIEGDPDAPSQIFAVAREVFLEYYKTVVAPTLKIAETDDRMAECAIRLYFKWERWTYLYGISGDGDDAGARGSVKSGTQGEDPEFAPLKAEGHASIAKIMNNAQEKMMQRALEGCRRHELASYNRILAMMREVELMGLPARYATLSVADVEDRMREECDRWEVELVSDVRSSLPSGTSRFELVSNAAFEGTGKNDDAPLNYRTLEISGNPFKDMGNTVKAGLGDALLQKKSPFHMLDIKLSKAGSRHGSVKVIDVHWDNVSRDTTGTSCAGTTENQTMLVADKVEVTLLITPPTEIVRFTPDVGPPSTSDMHEWMRFFTAYRTQAGPDIAAADGSKSDGQPEHDEKAQVVTVRVEQGKPATPGVWRAEFKTADGAIVGGKGLSETGYLILRHTPK